MPYNQNGWNASPNIDTYNDVSRDQVNNYEGSTLTFTNVANKLVTFLKGYGNIGNTINYYGGSKSITSVDNSVKTDVNDHSRHETLNSPMSIQAADCILLGSDTNIFSSHVTSSLLSSRDRVSLSASEGANPTSFKMDTSDKSPTILYPPNNFLSGVPPHSPAISVDELSTSPTSKKEVAIPQLGLSSVATPQEPKNLQNASSINDNVQDPLNPSLTELARHMDADIQEVAQRIASWFHPDKFAHDLSKSVSAIYPNRQNPTVSAFISHEIKRGTRASSVILPVILCLFCARLLERVFEPFAPGLDEKTTKDLSDRNSNIACSETARGVAKGFLAAVRDFIPALLPTTTSINLPNIFTEFEHSVTATVSKAIELQDHIRMHSQPRMYQVYGVKPGNRFDPGSADPSMYSSDPCTSNRDPNARVLGCTRLGLGIMPLGATDELEILWKAEVITT